MCGTTRTFVVSFTYNLSIIICVTDDPLRLIFKDLFQEQQKQIKTPILKIIFCQMGCVWIFEENQDPVQGKRKKKRGSYSVLGGVSDRLRLWNCDLFHFNLNLTLLKHQSLWSYCFWNKTWCFKRKTKFCWIRHSLCVSFFSRRNFDLFFLDKLFGL